MATQSPQTAAPQVVNSTETPEQQVLRLQKELKGVIPRARAAMLWERTLPRILPSIGLTSVFLGSAMSGVWTQLPHDGRMIGVGLFSLALVAALAPLRHIRMPSRAEAVARVEANTGLPHNPVSSILGKPFHPPGSEAMKLWDLHQQETAAKVGHFRAGAPNADMKRHDPAYILRTLPAFALALGMVFGGFNALDNLAQPFDWTAPPPIPAPIIPAKVDAWVTPPQYTSQAPIFLTNESVVRAETPVGSELVAPVGSRMTIRVVGGDSTVTVTGDAIIEREPPPLPTAEEAAATQTTRPVPARPIIREYEIVMQDDATVHIEAHGGVVMSWRFDITGDRAPQATVQASENPERPGTVDLEYRVDDDYGAISVQTEIQDGEAPRSQSTRPPRPLVTPPQINLPVPR